MSDRGGRRARLAAACAVLCMVAGSAGCTFEPEGVEVELFDGTILESAELVDFDNDRGESLQGVMLTPDAPAPVPAVVVLHGSGGLFTEPDRNDELLEVAPQFSDWAGMLTERGYMVLLPSSFYSRGYFEWGDHPRGTDEVDRMVMRTYDAYAALRFACQQPFVDCDRVGVLGFSNGGSVTLMSMHEGLDEVEGMSELTPAAERERFAEAVSYYPGCGLQGLVGDEYFPSARTTIEHASKDSLLDDCPERVEAVEAAAQTRSIDAPLTMTIHEGADHGFDDDPRNDADVRARDGARARSLESLARTLAP